MKKAKPGKKIYTLLILLAIAVVGFSLVWVKSSIKVKKVTPAREIEENQDFLFIRDLIKSLHYVKLASQRLQKLESADYVEEIMKSYNFVDSIESANKNLEAARKVLEKHQNRPPIMEQIPIHFILSAFDRYIQMNGEKLELCQKISSPEMKSLQQEVVKKKFASDFETFAFRENEIKRAFLSFSFMISYIIADQIPGKKFSLTPEERASLVKEIGAEFDRQIVFTEVVTENYIDNCLTAIYQALSHPEKIVSNIKKK